MVRRLQRLNAVSNGSRENREVDYLVGTDSKLEWWIILELCMYSPMSTGVDLRGKDGVHAGTMVKDEARKLRVVSSTLSK